MAFVALALAPHQPPPATTGSPLGLEQNNGFLCKSKKVSMLEHGWEKRSPKRACEHADRAGGRTDGLKGVWRVSSLCCLTSLPAPFPAAAAPHTRSGQPLAPASDTRPRLCWGLLLPVAHGSRLLFVHDGHLLRNVH